MQGMVAGKISRGKSRQKCEKDITSILESTICRRCPKKIDEFLAARSQFDSDHGVDFYAPTCCQSATFVRPLFAFYCPVFFTGKKMWHFATDHRRDVYAARLTLRD